MRTKPLATRLFALFLAALLLFSLIPLTALAEEPSVSETASLQETETAEPTADPNNTAEWEEEPQTSPTTDPESEPESTPDAAPEETESLQPEETQPVMVEEEDITVSNETVNADPGYSVTTTAVLMTNPSSPQDSPSQQIVLESYLTNTTSTEVEIKPCDIVFVLDQSKWMNTDSDAGAQRAAIIAELRELLASLQDPTTGGEHRIAIAGYGRLNMNASTDPYDAAIYPGTRATGGGISLNTGYYTPSGFVSQNGWSDVSQSAMTSAQLPVMAKSYQENMTYDNTFMTVAEASAVLDEDTMLAWYAGASRMDAGLTLAEQLATVADEHDPNGERNLIVCVLSSSLPIQNTAYTNQSTIRTAAVLAASEKLKSLGATIFAFGDYHASGKNISGGVQDTEDTFDSYMQQLCTQPDYFYSFTDFASVTDALNAMITKITIIAAGAAEQEHTVSAQTMIDIESEDGQSITWQSILDSYGDKAQDLLEDTMAQVAYYKFDHYDADGNPVFEDDAYEEREVALSTLASLTSDSLTYDTKLVPLPDSDETDSDGKPAHYGNKIVITIAAPVTVTYQWASDATDYTPAGVKLPDNEIVVLGKPHTPDSVKGLDQADDHYEFEGWYLDAGCTQKYNGTQAITGNLTLYGKWERFVLVEYYWDIWSGNNYATPDDEEKEVYGNVLTPYEPEMEGYTFDGWYLTSWYVDPECTDEYTPQSLTKDLKLYAKWNPKEDTAYTILYYQQNLEDDHYTEITQDTQNLTGTTESAIGEITKTYEGFTRSHITYESSQAAAQTDPLTIQGDGSLVVRVYYDRNTYTVTYEGNGSDGGTLPVDTTAYRYGTTVTVAQDTMTRRGYTFAGWQLSDGTTYAPGDTFAITQNTTLTAQWEEIPLVVPTGVGAPDQALPLAVLLVAAGGMVLLVGGMIWRKRKK